MHYVWINFNAEIANRSCGFPFRWGCRRSKIVINRESNGYYGFLSFSIVIASPKFISVIVLVIGGKAGRPLFRLIIAYVLKHVDWWQSHQIMARLWLISLFRRFPANNVTFCCHLVFLRFAYSTPYSFKVSLAWFVGWLTRYPGHCDWRFVDRRRLISFHIQSIPLEFVLLFFARFLYVH